MGRAGMIAIVGVVCCLLLQAAPLRAQSDSAKNVVPVLIPETRMDAMMLILSVALFFLTWGLVRLCEKV